MFLLVQQAIDLDWGDVKEWYRTHRAVFASGATAVTLLIATAGTYAFEAPDRLIGRNEKHETTKRITAEIAECAKNSPHGAW